MPKNGEICCQYFREYNIEISGAQKSKLVQDSSDEVFMVLIMISLIISTISLYKYNSTIFNTFYNII